MRPISDLVRLNYLFFCNGDCFFIKHIFTALTA